VIDREMAMRYVIDGFQLGREQWDFV